MTDRLVAGGAALFFLIMALAFGLGAAEVLRSHRQYADYANWAESPGRLRFVEVRESFYRLRWRWAISCEYDFPVAGREFLGNEFDLHQPRFDRVEQAQRFVERALGLPGPAQWRRVSEDYGVAWRLESAEPQLRVRYAPRDPTIATLTDTPPTTGFFDWVGVAVLALLSLVTALGALGLAGVALGRKRVTEGPP